MINTRNTKGVVWMAKISYSTQIEYETLQLLNEYIELTKESKASVTNEALRELIIPKLAKLKETK